MLMIRVMNEDVEHLRRTALHLLLTRRIIRRFVLLLRGRLMKQRVTKQNGGDPSGPNLWLHVSRYNIPCLHTPTPKHVAIMSGLFNK